MSDEEPQKTGVFDALRKLDDRPKPPPRQPIPQSSSGPNFNPTIEDPRTRGAVKAAFKHSFDNIVNAAANGIGRNETLNTEAFNLGQLIENRLVTVEQVEQHLLGACAASGLLADDGQAQCEASMRGGIAAGRASGPRTNLPKMEPQVAGPRGRIPVSGPDDEDESPGPTAGTVAETGDTDGPFDWKVVPGGTFILDVPTTIPTIWGTDEAMLWIEGESLMIAGGQGLGKTTIAGQVIHAQIFGGEVLDLPVQQLKPDQRILYLAMDRPRQIARSLLRQFRGDDREMLNDKLLVRPGPPVADLAGNTALLVNMAQALECTHVYVDSLKDAAVGLVDDEVAAMWNRARQTALAEGIQLCELHHNKKHKSGDNWDISDVYGSNWITAGLGSIVMLTGAPGDPIIGFRHIKQPSEEIGPFRLAHDQIAGTMTIHHDVDLLAMARAAQPEGLSAKGAAAAIFDVEIPGRGDIEKARRKLDKLVEQGWLRRMEGTRGAGNSATWHPSIQTLAEREWNPSD